MSVSGLQLAAAVSAVFLVGCAAPRSEWRPAGYYVTTQPVLGCDAFEGKAGTPMKQSAVLSLMLQRRLLTLLDQAASQDEKLRNDLEAHRDQLMCWYETPESDIQLSLGAFCDSPLEIEFHSRSAEWTLRSAELAIVECLPTGNARTRDR